jgi:tetratricopeptide (TPR) repeat protein
MARRDDHIPVEVRRAVWLHSYGLCQYRGCKKKLVSVDPHTGETSGAGIFAHILPVGDGARAEYKPQFPSIDINSAANLMLLCPDHHQLIDEIEPEKHPPEILFRLKSEKSILISDSITELLEHQTVLQTGIEDYQKEYQLSGVINLFKQSRFLGPKEGAAGFQEAEKTMRSLLKNPFFKKGEAGEVLINTEYYYTKLFLSYKIKNWREALQHTTHALRLPLPDPMLFHLFSCSMTLVRDEYGAFPMQEKLTLIAQLIDSIHKKVDTRASPGRAAFLLLVKSALLRWRGRFERGPNQRKTYGEAERCCKKSYELSNNPGCLLQSALINYSTAVAFQLREAPKHRPFFVKCFELLESPPLVEFPAAVKYRPRIYRDTYRFSDSIEAFWRGEAQYPNEFLRVAYIVGEAAVGEHYHAGREDLGAIADANSFLERAISDGYNHGRNVAAYISCRGVLEPDWFSEQVLKNLFDTDGRGITWGEILTRVRNILYDPKDKYDEPSFGVDEGEFWNTVGGVTGRTLKDHDTAIRLLQIAERHSEVSGGRFRAFVGLARQYKEIGDVSKYKHYLNSARTVGRSHQQSVIAELENW